MPTIGVGGCTIELSVTLPAAPWPPLEDDDEPDAAVAALELPSVWPESILVREHRVDGPASLPASKTPCDDDDADDVVNGGDVCRFVDAATEIGVVGDAVGDGVRLPTVSSECR